MSVYAVIDVGTNSVKLLIREHHQDGSWKTIVDRTETTRLGEGLSESFELSPAAIKRTVDAVAGMVYEAKGEGAWAPAVVGTMALRVARNRESFAAALRERCDVNLEVVSGGEEARLAFVAAVSELGIAPGTLVVFDTGGGSTQFTIGRGTEVDDRFSLNVGAVRLTEQFRLDRQVSPDHLRRVLAHLSEELGRLDRVPRPEILVGIGGAITNMAAVMHGLVAYNPDVVQGSMLPRVEVDRQIELYRSRDSDARRQIVGLQPSRADVILAGACVVRTVMEKLARDTLCVSDRGFRHGLLLDRFGQEEAPDQAGSPH